MKFIISNTNLEDTSEEGKEKRVEGLKILSSLLGYVMYSNQDGNVYKSNIPVENNYSDNVSKHMINKLYSSENTYILHFNIADDTKNSQVVLDESNAIIATEAGIICGASIYLYFVCKNGSDDEYKENCSTAFHEIRHAYGYAVGRHIPRNIIYYTDSSLKGIPLEEALVTGIIKDNILNSYYNKNAKEYLNKNGYIYNNEFNENSYRRKLDLTERTEW